MVFEFVFFRFFCRQKNPALIWKHIKSRTAVTAFAIGKIQITECAAVVVASAAANRVAGGKMLYRHGRGNLLRLRHICSHRMTLITAYALPERMIGMAENGFKDRPDHPCSPIRRQFVADTARTDIAFGRMASVAICVSIDADRN